MTREADIRGGRRASPPASEELRRRLLALVLAAVLVWYTAVIPAGAYAKVTDVVADSGAAASRSHNMTMTPRPRADVVEGARADDVEAARPVGLEAGDFHRQLGGGALRVKIISFFALLRKSGALKIRRWDYAAQPEFFHRVLS